MFNKLKERAIKKKLEKQQAQYEKQAIIKRREQEILRLMNSNISNQEELLIVLDAMRYNQWYRITVLNKVYVINKERDGEYNIQGIKKDYYKNEIVAKLLKRPMPKDKKGNYLRG